MYLYRLFRLGEYFGIDKFMVTLQKELIMLKYLKVFNLINLIKLNELIVNNIIEISVET